MGGILPDLRRPRGRVPPGDLFWGRWRKARVRWLLLGYGLSDGRHSQGRCVPTAPVRGRGQATAGRPADRPHRTSATCATARGAVPERPLAPSSSWPGGARGPGTPRSPQRHLDRLEPWAPGEPGPALGRRAVAGVGATVLQRVGATASQHVARGGSRPPAPTLRAAPPPCSPSVARPAAGSPEGSRGPPRRLVTPDAPRTGARIPRPAVCHSDGSSLLALFSTSFQVTSFFL